MSTSTDTYPTQPGETGTLIHALVTGMTVHLGTSMSSPSRVLRRGDELLVTEQVRGANTDRFGSCVFDLTPAQQRARWGEVRFAPGPFPADHDVYEPGSLELYEAREQARRHAWTLPDDQRAQALAAVTAKYGAGPVTSKTLKAYNL